MTHPPRSDHAARTDWGFCVCVVVCCAVELDVVYESHSRVTSASYSNRQSVDRWSIADTRLFYKALSQYGTDFQLIAQLFPKRDRKQVKAKFKKEEKNNPRLIDQALRTRLPIDVSEFERAMQRTAQEKEELIDVEAKLAAEDKAAADAAAAISAALDAGAAPAGDGDGDPDASVAGSAAGDPDATLDASMVDGVDDGSTTAPTPNTAREDGDPEDFSAAHAMGLYGGGGGAQTPVTPATPEM